MWKALLWLCKAMSLGPNHKNHILSHAFQHLEPRKRISVRIIPNLKAQKGTHTHKQTHTHTHRQNVHSKACFPQKCRETWGGVAATHPQAPPIRHLNEGSTKQAEVETSPKDPKPRCFSFFCNQNKQPAVNNRPRILLLDEATSAWLVVGDFLKTCFYSLLRAWAPWGYAVLLGFLITRFFFLFRASMYWLGTSQLGMIIFLFSSRRQNAAWKPLAWEYQLLLPIRAYSLLNRIGCFHVSGEWWCFDVDRVSWNGSTQQTWFVFPLKLLNLWNWRAVCCSKLIL